MLWQELACLALPVLLICFFFALPSPRGLHQNNAVAVQFYPVRLRGERAVRVKFPTAFMKKRSSTQELIAVEAGGGGVRPCSARVQQERPHGRLLSRLSLWRFLLTGTSVTLAAEAVASLVRPVIRHRGTASEKTTC